MPPCAPPATAARQIRCPACGGPSLYSPDNAWRPFCSQRCKLMDLGAWGREDFRVPAQVPPEDAPLGDPRRNIE